MRTSLLFGLLAAVVLMSGCSLLGPVSPDDSKPGAYVINELGFPVWCYTDDGVEYCRTPSLDMQHSVIDIWRVCP